MGTRKRLLVAAACVSLATLPLAAAFGDTITNNLDATADTVAEVMSLNVGGPAGTTQLYVMPTNNDGKNGCNFTGPSPTFTVSVSSSDESVAKVSPASVTFTSCDDTKLLTVTPVAVGTATVSLTQTGNTSAGSFTVGSSTFTAAVAPPLNTAPQMAVTGVEPGGEYPKGSVPPAVCERTDTEDGDDSSPAALSPVTGPHAADGIGQQTASCSYTDTGGLSAVASLTYFIVDPTAPVVTYILDPAAPDGDNGWYTGDVSLMWTVAEPETPSSVQRTGCAAQTVVADQTEQSSTCAATSAGGTSATVTATVRRDATTPTGVTFAGGPADGGVYFPNSVPAAGTCDAADATSGLAGCTVTGRSTALGTHTLTAVATDNAGNTSTAGRSYLVRRLELGGFLQPVDLGGVWNTVKNGQTVPLKFTVKDRGVAQTSLSVVKSFTQAKVTCTNSNEDTVEEVTSTGGTALRYDTVGGQYVQNWKTPAGAGSCYRVTLTLVDDTTQTALFKLR